MLRCLCLCLLVVAYFLCAPVCYGQTTVWLSDNATYSDLDITTAAPPGTTGSFDIWVKTHELDRLVSVSLDLMTMGEAMELTGADIVIGQDRFRLQGNPMVTDDGVAITNMWAFAGAGLNFGTGIGRPGVPVDDEALGAYRFARIYYRIVELGISNLQLKVGQSVFGNLDPNILHLGIDDPSSVGHMPGATDIIIDGRIHVVPEPSSVLLLFVGGLSLLKR